MKIFTFKQGGFTAFLRATLLLVMMFTSSVTFADYKFPAYISDLKLIGGTEAETAVLLKKYKSEGWTCTEYDLNYGCKSGADRIYLLYKSTVFASTNGGFVTGLIIDTSSKFKETIKSDGHTYKIVPYEGGSHFKKYHGDLNSNAGGNDYHLYYTKENFSDKRVIDDIRIYATTKDNDFGAMQQYSFFGYNLNGGCKNCNTKIYLHYRTQTKVNRPENLPVFNTDATYGGNVLLIKSVPKNDCDLEFCVDDVNGTYTSYMYDVRAKTVGYHTVYMVALENKYGVKSGAYPVSVYINKSPNNQVTMSESIVAYDQQNVASYIRFANPNLNDSKGAVTYKYSTSKNGTFTTAVPTTPGTYYVKATIAGDNNCYEYTTDAVAFKVMGWQGKGTSEAPYLIKTIDDMNLLARNTNKGVDYKGMYFRLENNITYTNSDTYAIIGAENSSWFDGNFDGNGKCISGINFNLKDKRVVGLFGTISSYATVKNLTVSNCKFTSSGRCGSIAGSSDGAVINCHVENVEVTGSSECGGIVGEYYEGIFKDNTAIGVKVNGGSKAGVIYGNKNRNYATPENNYYLNCKLVRKNETKTEKIGAELDDVTKNNGAVQVYKLIRSNNVVTKATPAIAYNGDSYYAAGTTIELDDNLKKKRVSCRYGFAVNDEAISSNSFVMPAKEVTVSLKAEQLYEIAFEEGVVINTTATKTSGSGINYYAEGTQVELSYTEPDDKVFKEYVVDGTAITGNTFTMPKGNVAVSATLEQLYALTLNDGVTTSTPATKVGSDGTKYYSAGTEIELTSSVPDDFMFKGYNVNDKFGSDNKFTMPAQNTTVSASLEELYTLTFNDGVATTTAATKVGSDGTAYYKAGERINLTCEVPDDKMLTGFTIDGYVINSTSFSFSMHDHNVTVGATMEQLYAVTFGEGVSTSTPATKVGKDGTMYYSAGVEVELSCTVEDDELFRKYIVNDDETTSYKFAMPSQNTTVSAVIEKLYTIKLNNGVKLNVAAAKKGKDGTDYFAAGSKISVSFIEPDDKVFKNYTVNGKDIAGWSFTMPSQNTIVGANLEQLYSVTCNDNAFVSTEAKKMSRDGIEYFSAGEEIELTYSVSEDFMLNGYTVNGSAITGNKFTMPAQNTIVGATYTELFTISYEDGVATSTAATKVGEDGTKYYAPGTKIKLSCPVADDEMLSSYLVNGVAISGNSLDMPDESILIGADIEKLYTITLGEGITTSTNETKVGKDGTKYYASGTNIELSYSVPEGFDFVGYDVNGSIVRGESFSMLSENVVVSASLEQKKFTVMLYENDMAEGSVTGEGEYVYGATVTVTATANEGYVFVGWMDQDENIVSTEATYRFTATDNQRLVAIFKVDESTDIEIVNAQSDKDVWYTLNGHKLAGKPTQKGVYIHNNKKVVIK